MSRARHSGLLVNETTMVVFGGCTGGYSNGDCATQDDSVWLYDISSNTWQEIPSTSTNWPSAREGHVAAIVTNNNGSEVMLVHGGRGNYDYTTDLEDLWAFDFATTTWQELKPPDFGCGRYEAAA